MSERLHRYWARPVDPTKRQGDPRIDPLEGCEVVVSAKEHDAVVMGFQQQVGAAERQYQAERQAHNQLKVDAWNNIQALQKRISELEEHNMRLGQGDAERYWEDRYRTEAAHTNALLAELKALREERQRWQALLHFTEVPGPDKPSSLEVAVALFRECLQDPMNYPVAPPVAARIRHFLQKFNKD